MKSRIQCPDLGVVIESWFLELALINDATHYNKFDRPGLIHGINSVSQTNSFWTWNILM